MTTESSRSFWIEFVRSIGRGRGGGFRRPTGLRPGVLHGRPSQAITTGAGMAAGEKRREVGRLSPMSTDVDIGATWASVVRVVALHRPVQVLLGVTMHLSTLPC